MCSFWNVYMRLFNKNSLKHNRKTLAQVNDPWPWHTCIDVTSSLIVIVILPCFLSAWSYCCVWEGDCASGGPGEVDCTRLLRMGPLSEGRASQALCAPGAGDQREAGGPPPLSREHPDQRPQLQGCPEGEVTARWAPAETSISSSLFFLFRLFFKAFLHSKRLLQCLQCLWAAALNVYVFVSCLRHKSAYVYCPLVGLTSVVLTGVIHQHVAGIPPDIMSWESH